MEQLLEGKTAVITGASSGNGRGIALTFAEHGADVVVADIQREPRSGKRPTVDMVRDDTEADATYADCDVTDVDDIEAAVEAADKFGGIDIMVNNAGLARKETFSELTEEEYRTMMDVNLKGVCFGTRVAVQRMRSDDREGSIINMSSLSGILGSPNSPIYSASKGGVRLFTYSIASRYGRAGIRANVIHPGVVDTAMLEDIDMNEEATESFSKRIPLQRVAQPQDIANAALFLASDLSSYVTGSSLVVDGGYHSSFV